VDFKLNV